MRSTLVSISIIALVASACQSRDAKADLVAAEAAVKEASANFSAAETSGKQDSALTFMWEDAVLQPPDTVQIEGRDAVRAFYSRAKHAPPPADSAPPRSARTIQISASGDLAAEWGPGAIEVVTPTGPVVIRFKFMILWERRGGIWKLRFNSWSGQPAGKATPAKATS
jgi:ketosteroid isomerase-like protein